MLWAQKRYPAMKSQGRSYAAAIDALNSLQSNAATIEAIRKSGKTVNELNEPEMVEYLARIGHRRDELDQIGVVHITGTKGKGSTAAFCDALLRKVRTDDSKKIGLYTSPHMVAARERIRIDGVPLPEEIFARYFWEVWERLEMNSERQFSETPLRPVYFRFMTLLAFHVFISERVAATLLEVGIGGLYDSTNIVQRPVVTGVTPLGLDHTAILGTTIEEIALQKAGIFKQGAPALTVKQSANAMDAMRSYSDKVRVSKFQVVPELPALEHVPLGLPGPHQRTNASLALALVQEFAASKMGQSLFPGASEILATDRGTLTKPVAEALRSAFWPGRCQIVPAQNTAGATFFLDGAHTTESIAICVCWFVQQVSVSKEPRVFIFNCTNGRSGHTLLQTVLKEIGHSVPQDKITTFFSHVFFCTNNTYANGDSASGTLLAHPDLVSRAIDPQDLESMSLQQELLRAWCSLLHLPTPEQGQLSVTAAYESRVHVVPSIEHALRTVQAMKENPNVLVAGSLHLVGGVMAHLQDQGVLDERLKVSTPTPT